MTKVEAIKEFRSRTGLPIWIATECVSATNLDVGAAIEFARAKGYMTYSPKEGRTPNGGRISAFVSQDGKVGAMVELICETDFSARTDVFGMACDTLARFIADGGMQDREKLDKFIEDLKAIIREDIRIGRYEVFDMRD